MLEIISYPPVLRGFILLCITGSVFPLSGVYIIRMNLLPIRFLLMHGVMLGGALALAMDLNASILSLAVNILLILIMHRSVKTFKTDYGQVTMFFMVTAIAAASIIISKFNVPAKDTLTLLWGSLYTSEYFSIITSFIISIILVLFTVVFFRHITAIFYDKDIALSLSIKVRLFELAIILIIALVISSAMKLMGALLVDAVILLPAVIAAMLVNSLKKLMILSCILGSFFSVSGFLISLYFDIPLSAGVTVPASLMFTLVIILKHWRKINV